MTESTLQNTSSFLTYKDYTSSRASLPVTSTASPLQLFHQNLNNPHINASFSTVKSETLIAETELRELTEFCMQASNTSLSKIWTNSEDDAAWAYLA